MDPWHIASGVVCIIAGLVLSAIVLHPRINEGLIVKAGLIAMILSLFATAALTFSGSIDWPGYWRAAFTLRAGLAVACVGILWRASVISRAKKKTATSNHESLTKAWLYRITEPVNDMAHLFQDERETEKHK